jgi:ATP-dependent RNA helicase RhlE
MKFSTLGLCEPILKAVAEEGYDTPTPIQAEAIPAVIQGRDVMAAAQTGTGKTAAFTLPILEKLAAGGSRVPKQARVLVLTPTRELAAQVVESVATYGRYLKVRTAVVFGGVNANPQIKALSRGVDVLVATPGRLLDLHGQRMVDLGSVEVLVLDEADRMLDMGFIHDIKRILNLLPKQRQNLMFSATFSQEIRNLAKGLINDPVEISVTPRNTTVEAIAQCVYQVDKQQKAALLIKLIKENNWEQVLVFSRTKHGANKLARQLESSGINASAIHGNKSQGARTSALAGFKNGSIRILVATDIAARGLDIDLLPHVVNYDLPHVPQDYIHRIGRTGRAGASGEAVSLVCADESKQLTDIEKLIKIDLERRVMEGFEPVHSVSSAPRTQTGSAPAARSGHRGPQRSGFKAQGLRPRARR